mgnify:FL=1
MAVEVHRIEKEFIFRSYLDSGDPIEVQWPSFRANATIIDYTDQDVTLELAREPKSSLAEGGRVNAYFSFRDQPMTFTSNAVNQNGTHLKLLQPTEIYRDLNRDFERIFPPQGLTLSITIDGQELTMQFPDSELYEPVEEPTVATNFDAAKIGELLKTFRERADEFASENKIIMFRERTPQTRPEHLISRSGKILTLPLWELGPDEPQAVRQRILTKERVRALAQAYGDDADEVEADLDAVYEESRKNHIRHEMYCPILYHQYVVGYMYLIRTDEDPGGFDAQAVEFALQFGRILSYSLKVNGYFVQKEHHDRIVDAEVIDISGSGVLVAIPKEKVAPVIFTTLELKITFDQGDEKKEIDASGVVARRFTDQDRVYIGVHFTRMDHVDKTDLIELLYGRS